MKNLKKVLALGLALVMILGMFTIASAAETKKTAADFTDWDKVEHKDAVALAYDLGIINGKPDGSFDPQGNIDRASWAKLVYFTATGDDNADAYLGTNAGLKDIKGNWAESYINYLVANKYVSGDNVGNYNPNGPVTVAAGLKTMLTVLGYDANDRGYQNDNAWMGNIMTDAKRNGLMDNVDRAQTAAVNLTRENAAEIVYNTLQAETVIPENGRDNGEKYVTTYTKSGNSLGLEVFKALPVEVAVTVETNGDVKLTPDLTGTGITGLNASDLKNVTASSTLAGENAVVWVKVKGTNNKAFDSVVSAAVSKSASSANKTFTDLNGSTNVITLPEKTDGVANQGYDKDHFVAEAATAGVQMYMDGAKVTGDQTVSRGDVVDVYTDAEGKVATIKITTWKTGKLDKDLETRTSGGKLQVRLPGVTTDGLANWKDADTITGYQGLVEDDVILYNKDAKNNFTIEKAEKVTGKVTARNGSSDAKLTIGGTQYQASKIDNVPSDLGFDAWDVKGNADNEYDFFLDKNGTVCYKILIEGEEKKEVAYVLDAAYVTGSGIQGSYYAEAELLFADGTSQIIRVAKVGDTKMDKDAASTGATTMNGLVGKFVDYSVSDNAYNLSTAKAGANIGAFKNGETPATLVDIANEIAFAKNVSVTANAKTVFIVKKGDNYEVFTGFENLPKMKACGAYAAETGKAATYVYLETDSYDGEAPSAWVYIADKDAFSINADDLCVYEVYETDGTKTTMPVYTTKSGSTYTTVVTAPGFYKIDKVNESEGNTLVQVTMSDFKTLEVLADGVLTITGADPASVPYDKSTVGVVVDIDKDGEFVSVSSFDPNAFTIEDSTTYTYTAMQDGGKADAAADFIYVIRTEVGA